jgi:NADPH-dependent curcumin reductase CurA
MTDHSTLQNHQIRLAARPVGMTTRENWRFTSEAVAEPEQGGVLVKTLCLSLDPAMRGWMNEGKSYIAPVEIGEVMRAGGIGKVVASKHERFGVGDLVTGGLGVQEYRRFAPAEIKRQGISKIDLRMGTITQWLNVLGMPGMTGYFGLMDVGQPKEGDVVVVSGASGAVGQTVGQLAKIKGCRVVGIAGGKAKCDFVVDEMGFDACIDYKNEDVRTGLKKHCPDGIDIYFDNVGGESWTTCWPACAARRASSSAGRCRSTTAPLACRGRTITCRYWSIGHGWKASWYSITPTAIRPPSRSWPAT